MNFPKLQGKISKKFESLAKLSPILLMSNRLACLRVSHYYYFKRVMTCAQSLMIIIILLLLLLFFIYLIIKLLLLLNFLFNNLTKMIIAIQDDK